MAQSNTTSAPSKHGGQMSSSLFSLTGYLQLQQKNSYFFKSGARRYWFWFDEKTCSLKYYKNKETYIKGVHEPAGTIDLRYAKVTPGITSGSKSNNSFHISVNGQMHLLAASSNDEALEWISNLQGKRGEYIKVSSVMNDTAMEHERDKRTLKPLNKPVGALASSSITGETAGTSPITVRKIIHSKINRGSLSLELTSIPPSDDPPRRSTIDPLTLGAENTSTSSPSYLPPTPEVDEGPRHMSSPMIVTSEEVDCGLKPESRKIVELEACVLQSQTEIDRMHKEILKTKERLEERDQVIMDINKENFMLKEEIAKMKKPRHELQSEITSLKDIIEQYKRSLKSLDDEIELHKLNQKEHEKRINIEKQRVAEMEREMNVIKSKYVTLLSTKFKVQNPHSREEVLEDMELVKYTNELLALMKQEGGEDPASYRGSFEDPYGDIHDWQTDVVTQHYLCRQLYLHYNQQDIENHTHDWDDYLSQVKRSRKPYLELLSGDKAKKELRVLLRKGVPLQYRVIVWNSLIFHHVGRMKELLDASHGGSYYASLVQSCQHEMDLKTGKQIKTDLHRTLPNNRHFKLNGSGIPKLNSILCAFSIHNRAVGYCQSMNMLAALGLIFLDEETVFWMMVAVIEKILPGKYYTPDLAGVQADQKVLRDLVREKLPRLHTHFELFSIETSFVTLNWFLTIFIDSMPTESAMRIMDCFLLEGTKFLFRTSLSILKMNQSLIIKKNDLFSLLQFIKELAKHIFDMDSLFQEFDKLAPFPTTSTLASRHHTHLVTIQDSLKETRKQFKEKEMQRSQLQQLTASYIKEPNQAIKQRLVWECGCVCGSEEVWLFGGEGKLGIISAENLQTLHVPDIKVLPRIICAYYLPLHDLVLVGSLDFNLVAIDFTSKAEQWRCTLKDSVLSITASRKGQVFAALANGSVAVIQEVSVSCPPDPLLLKIGTTSVNSVALAGRDERYLWCGYGKSIAVMCTETLELVESLVMSDGSVNKLVGSEVGGVWVSFRSSTFLSLYDTRHCVPLLRLDYLTLLPPELGMDAEKDLQKSNHRVTSLMTVGRNLWVGTGGGRVAIFSCLPNVENTEEMILKLLKRIKASKEETTPTTEHSNGGLLSQEVENKKSDERQAALDNGTSDSPIPSHYQRRRKTQFGKTLRNKTVKDRPRELLPDVYRLEYEHCSHVVTASNESVRVMLSVRDHSIGCVNTIKSDWKKGVHLWTCPPDTPPNKWSFEIVKVEEPQ